MKSASGARNVKSLAGLGAIALVYLLLRAWILATAFDDVSIPVYEHSPMGNLAAATAGIGADEDGGAGSAWGAPLAQYYDNCGGHLVVGLLAAPLFRVFGDSYLVLKLVPVGLGLATLVLVWALVRYALRGVEGREAAAALAALAFALGPPTLTKYSMLAKGNHFENLAFQLVAVGLGLRAVQSALAARWVFAAGAAAGFAIFVYMGSLLAAVLLGLGALLVAAPRGPRALARAAGIGLAGFAMGLLPVVWIQLATGGRVLNFLAQKSGARESLPLASRIPERVQAFVTDLAPRAGCFPDLGPLPGGVAEALFWGLFALAWFALAGAFVASLRAAWEAARSVGGDEPPHGVRPVDARDADARDGRAPARALLLALLLGYFPLWFAAYTIGRFDFDPYGPPVEIGQFRYLVPHYLFATVAIGVALGLTGARDRSALGTRARVLRGGARAGLALLAVTWLFLLPLGQGRISPAALRYAGHDLHRYSKIVLRDWTRDPATKRMVWDEARIADWVASMPRAWRHATYFGIGFDKSVPAFAPLAAGPDEPRIDGLLDAVLADCPPHYRADAAWGIGANLRRRFEQPLVQRLVAGASANQHALAPLVVEGLALEFAFPLARQTAANLATTAALHALVPPDWRGYVRRGQGRWLAGPWLRDLPEDRAAIAAALAAVQPAAEPAAQPGEQAEFWFGFGFGVAIDMAQPRLRERPARSLGALRDVCPPAAWARIFEGLGAGLRHVGGESASASLPAALVSELAALGETERTAFERGGAWPGYPAPYALAWR